MDAVWELLKELADLLADAVEFVRQWWERWRKS